MATQSSHLDEKFAGTYRKLFDTIERGGDQCSKDHLQTLLEEKCRTLALGLDAFTEPSAQSRTKVTTGPNVSIDGKTIKLEQPEKDLVCHLSDLLKLNELQCVSLWKAFRNGNTDIKVESSGDYRMSEDQGLIMRVISYYYEDRLALLQCVASLLRITNDDTHPFASIARNTMKTIESEVKDKTEFADRLLAQLKRLARQPVPSQCFTFMAWESFWAKQNLREQKSLLEILTLVYLTKFCPPPRILAIIQEFEATNFGSEHAFGYVLDKEGNTLRTEVSHLCVLLTVEVLALPYLKPELVPSGEQTETSLVCAPDVIVKINQVVLFLGDEKEHAIFLLAWSYFLDFVNRAISATTLAPSAYAKVKSLINGDLEFTTSELLTSRPMTRNASMEQAVAGRQPSIKQGAEMYRIFAGRSLKLDVFDCMSQILTSSLCDDDDPSSFGYRSILKGLLNTFLMTTSPIYLPAESFNDLVKCVSKLFDNESELCVSFWKDDYDESDECSLLATVGERFPHCFSDLTTLLSSLSGAKAADADAKKPAKHVFDFLRSMQTLTVMVKDTVPLKCEEGTDDMIVSNEQPIIVAGNIQMVHPIVIPAGSKGMRVTDSPESRLIKWGVKYSGWHLLVNVLHGFLQTDNTSTTLGVQDEKNQLCGGDLEVVNSILELLRKAFENNPTIVRQLVEHVEEARWESPSQDTSSKCPVLVSTLCQILSYCCSAQLCPILTVTSTLRCLTALLPFYRNEIWSYLESAPILPRFNGSYHLASRLACAQSSATDLSSQIQHIVANVECTNGRYPLLLAFLNLVTALVRDIQHHWWTSGPTDEVATSSKLTTGNNQYRVEVLYLCLHYLMLDVFPAYASWRYKFLSERFLIGSKVLTIFIEVVQYFKGPKAQHNLTLAGLRDDILDKFLYSGGAYHISPLLDIISDGASMANNLYHISRLHEATCAERLTELTFIFVKLLLQRRLELIHEGGVTRESALEHLMLEHTKNNSTPDFLHRLMKHIHYRHNIILPTLATNVVSLLCRSLSTWKTVPNFVQYLGDADLVREIIRSFLEIAKDHNQNERLLTSIWQMITLLFESQPTLAILFLECGENIMPSPRSAFRLEQQKSKQAKAGADAQKQDDAPASAIRSAINILDHWQMLSTDKPTVLSNVLRCLSTFWQTAFDHYAIVQVTRSDNKLWQALSQILMNTGDMQVPHVDRLEFEKPVTRIDEDIDGTASPILSNQSRETRRLCCIRLCKSLVMRIMSYEIHLTAGSGSTNSDTKVSDKLPAGLKALLAKMNEPGKLSGLRKLFLKNSYNASISSHMGSSAHMLLGLISVSNTTPLLQKVGPIGWGDDEVDGEGRQYGDSYLYDLRLAEARIHSLCEDIHIKYNVTDDDNVLVNKVRDASKQFLVDLCLANHNISLVDSEMILQKSFKTLTEICSSRAGDMIWADKNPATAMFDFMSELIQQAKEDKEKSGVALASYDLMLTFVRSLAEDWVKANRRNVASGPQAMAQVADQAFGLLSMLCVLLERENFAVMSSVRDYTTVAFHRPLLETIVLCLRTPQLKKPPVYLLDVTCASFQVLVYKAIAFGAPSDTNSDDMVEECIKDLTVVISLLSELVSHSYFLPAEWIAAFESYKTIPTLHKLLSDGIELVVSELDSQINAETINISPYAENALFLLLTLSNQAWAAEKLVAHGVTDLFCNNALTVVLQQGNLDAFVRFEDSNGNGPYGVERSPLHVIWCQMLGVTSNIVRTLGSEEMVLRSVTGFMQIYKDQIGRAFSNANGVNDSLLGLSPSESLSSPVLEEVEKIAAVFFGLAKHLDRVAPYASNLLVAYKDCTLQLIQRYHYFFTHPSHLQAQLFPLGPVEVKLAQTSETESTMSSSTLSAAKDDSAADKTTSKLMQVTMQRAVRILRTSIATLVLLTDTETILQHDDVEWPFGNTILYPTMQIGVGDSASFGTLTEYVNVGLSIVKQWQPLPHMQRSVSGMLDVIQGCLTLLATQAALWIAKPGMDEETRKEIASDNLMDIAETMTKAEATLKKLEDEKLSKGEELKRVRLELINPLQLFLTRRFFKAKE